MKSWVVFVELSRFPSFRLFQVSYVPLRWSLWFFPMFLCIFFCALEKVLDSGLLCYFVLRYWCNSNINLFHLWSASFLLGALIIRNFLCNISLTIVDFWIPWVIHGFWWKFILELEAFLRGAWESKSSSKMSKKM